MCKWPTCIAKADVLQRAESAAVEFAVFRADKRRAHAHPNKGINPPPIRQARSAHGPTRDHTPIQQALKRAYAVNLAPGGQGRHVVQKTSNENPHTLHTRTAHARGTHARRTAREEIDPLKDAHAAPLQALKPVYEREACTRQ